jgi:hypothetical protein
MKWERFKKVKAERNVVPVLNKIAPPWGRVGEWK